jgi:hypothetical protein
MTNISSVACYDDFMNRQYILKKNEASSIILIRFLLVLLFGIASICFFNSEPFFSIIAVDIVLCAYLVSLFQSEKRYLFLLNPIILLICSQLFSEPFLDGGDGIAYREVVRQYLDTSNMLFHADELVNAYGYLWFFKYASLPVAPVFAIPDYYFFQPTDQIYYLWQGLYHVALCSVVVTLARIWQVIDVKRLFNMALFSVLAPSFFDLGAAPTRHIGTFFGVFLLIITHLAIVQRFTVSKLLWFVLAVTMVLISKAPLLGPYLIFAIIDIIYFKRFSLSLPILILVCLMALGMSSYLFNTALLYEKDSGMGAATFSSMTSVPVVGWIIKYCYALLAPFPWSEAQLFTKINYSGNWLLFVSHMLSSLFGAHLFSILIIHYKAIILSDIELKRIMLYGLIMSLSILFGNTGYHTYLLIYFPFFAPLIGVKAFRVSASIPIIFIASLEFLMFIGR